MRGVSEYGTTCKQGRGEQATTDMKRRIAALRSEGIDVIEALWQRFEDATVRGEGFRYEYAAGQQGHQELVRPDGELDLQPCGR